MWCKKRYLAWNEFSRLAGRRSYWLFISEKTKASIRLLGGISNGGS